MSISITWRMALVGIGYAYEKFILEVDGRILAISAYCQGNKTITPPSLISDDKFDIQSLYNQDFLAFFSLLA